MKKIFTILSFAIFTLSAFSQTKIKSYDASIWGQSQRTKSGKGCSFSIKDAKPYAMDEIVKKNKSSAIDVMCSFSAAGKNAGFTLCAPGNPAIADIDYTPKTGTYPYKNFDGGSKDPEGAGWIKNWTTRNETKLQKVNADFDAATAETMNALNIESNYMIKGVKAGDVIAFETAATSTTPSKKGLIKIVSISDDPDRSDKAGEGSFQELKIKVKAQGN